MAWQFKREEQKFAQIPVGDHRIRVRSVEKAVSQKGNDMLAFQFDVSGYPTIMYHYITFLNDNPEITNRQLTQFFDSFKGIPEGDFDLSKWVGQVGACCVKPDKSDPDRTRISYFIKAGTRQDALPAWQEPPTGAAAGAFKPIDEEEIPFF